MPGTQVESRRELFDYFQKNIERSYESLSEDQELEHRQNLLKTFIIESNVEIKEFLTSFNVEKTKEIDSKLVKVLVEGEVEFFIDFSNPRFWLFYTLSKSRPSKRVIEKFMSYVRSGLDHPWMPIKLQEEFTELGEFRGLGAKYKPKKIFPEKYIEDKLSFGDLSIRSWGRGSQDLYDVLKGEKTEEFFSLSSIGIKRWGEGDDFILEDIGFDGRFTTRGGNSVQLHLDTVEQIVDGYSNLLETIENKHRITYQSKDEKIEIEGDPIVIDLKNEIENIEEFISYIVSSENPLRLWGLKTEIEEDYFKVKGIDLHNGDKYTMEMTPKWIRLYLPEAACGNTALRIFVNLQRYYDSSAEMEI
ncbi:hypothetical protein AMET1_0556 [Methanonatronarchaeum thermophilum]|uniref:Uncharacterized protein n=1 Tax=Methanonatronarchaeum thermophilum TaxID=1927129 RepID=A0A1Y3GHJ3_9EURY|nr:hypothetical protein [Methanonatronarchaeum thermophilum]OUJ18905.1 hypothetical protein AMET1_0556 [Methanonatronarchaeum thermophilum]